MATNEEDMKSFLQRFRAYRKSQPNHGAPPSTKSTRDERSTHGADGGDAIHRSRKEGGADGAPWLRGTDLPPSGEKASGKRIQNTHNNNNNNNSSRRERDGGPSRRAADGSAKESGGKEGQESGSKKGKFPMKIVLLVMVLIFAFLFFRRFMRSRKLKRQQSEQASQQAGQPQWGPPLPPPQPFPYSSDDYGSAHSEPLPRHPHGGGGGSSARLIDESELPPPVPPPAVVVKNAHHQGEAQYVPLKPLNSRFGNPSSASAGCSS